MNIVCAMETLALEQFAGNVSVIEPVLRGAVIYVLLALLFRFVVRHEAVSFGIAEMMVLVVLADASQGAITEEATSIAESAILASSMLACHLLRTAYALRHRLLRRLRMAWRLQRKATQLARNVQGVKAVRNELAVK